MEDIIMEKRKVKITNKPVLETTCIKQSTALRDYCSDTTLLLNPFLHSYEQSP